MTDEPEDDSAELFRNYEIFGELDDAIDIAVGNLTLNELQRKSVGKSLGPIVECCVKDNLSKLWKSLRDTTECPLIGSDGLWLTPRLMGDEGLLVPLGAIAAALLEFASYGAEAQATETLLRWKSAIDEALEVSRSADESQ